MSTTIKHQGVIESISRRHVRVRITQTAACAGCKISSHCTASESKIKVIDVYDDQQANLRNVGDNVIVATSGSAASKALLLSFGVPLLLMFILFFGASALGCSQGLSALLMLGGLVPYYIIIWCMRSKIAQQISFRIE